MKNELISREWLLDVVENIIKWDTERDRNRAIHQVRELTPAVDAVEVKHAMWVEKQHKMIGNTPCCSLCGWFVVIETSYCPGCGAKMDGGKHGTD